MERVQWAECCMRYESLWRTARLTVETTNAWYDEFGVWADYASTMRAINRLSGESERPPSLATWRELHGVMMREKHASQKREEGERVPDGPGSASWERMRKIGMEWMEINDSLHDESFAAIHAELQKQVVKPGQPTDAEGALVRESLIDELRARAAAGDPIERIPRGDPRLAAKRGTPKTRKGELTPIGEAL